MKVKEVFDYSISHEESPLAHYIFHLYQEKKITSEDDFSKLDFNQADHQKVEEMIINNVLGIYKISIYAFKKNEQDFVYIFARNSKEATQFFIETYYQPPVYCTETSLDTEFVRGKETVSFRDMRKEYSSFPAVAGKYSRRQYHTL